MPEISSKNPIYIAIGLLSAALIAFQLVLMQLFSIVQWHHFAFMVISLALMGFGTAGTILSLWERWLLKHYSRAVPLLCFLSGITMPAVVLLSGTESLRLDIYLLFNDYWHIGRLIATYLLFFLPFFFGALAVGISFAKFAADIHKLYFYDLVGSGLGSLLILLLMWQFRPEQLPAVTGLFPIVAGMLALIGKPNRLLAASAIPAIGAISWMLLYPPSLAPSQFKEISKTLLLPDAKISLAKSSPYGLIQVVEAPALRYAPGLSLNYQGAVPVTAAVFQNGNWLGPVMPMPQSTATTTMSFTTDALPYNVVNPESVLILAATTGEYAIPAISNKARRINLVEPNTVVTELLRQELTRATDSLFHFPALDHRNLEPRTFLWRTDNRFDLIVLPRVGTFGGSAGMQAIQEQYLLTKEAFRDCWQKLSPEGMISITCWMDYPFRNPLKLLATAVSTLEAAGLEEVRRHLVAVRSWNTLTLVIRKAPINETEERRIRRFCERMSFDPLLLPSITDKERRQYNQLQDSLFFDYVDQIMGPDRAMFYESYDFNIRPATDQSPYFYQFLRWDSLPHLMELFGNQTFPFFEIGYLAVLLTLAQVIPPAFLFMLLPHFGRGFPRDKQWFVWLYFSGIGIGYLFVEIVLIQQFVLFLGHPIYAAAAVIALLLISSGSGSYFSSQWRIRSGKLFPIAVVIAGLLFLYAFTLMPILQLSIGLPLWTKLLLSVFLLCPLGFLMGIPFPAGITYLHTNRKRLIPWAWGINGFFSVISAVLAMVVAVELGFFWVIILAALAYGLTAMASWIGN